MKLSGLACRDRVEGKVLSRAPLVADYRPKVGPGDCVDGLGRAVDPGIGRIDLGDIGEVEHSIGAEALGEEYGVIVRREAGLPASGDEDTSHEDGERGRVGRDVLGAERP